MKIKLIVVLLFVVAAGANAQNTVTGTGASTLGSGNTIYGYYAGDVNTANNNSFFGDNAGKSNTSGWLNTFVGSSSGQGNTTGDTNNFFGFNSGYKNTTGSSNVFIGNSSGYNNTIGYNNVCVGLNSGYGNVAGLRNTYLGYASAFGSTGTENTFAGYYSGGGNTGSSNTFVGSYAGRSSGASTGSVFLGYNAGYSETSSNKLYIDNSNTTVPLIYGDFSSRQIGINIRPNTTHTLTVGGTIHATGIYVNGVSLSDGGFEFWTKAGNNVWNNTGNVGIGTTLANNPNNYKLAVKGKLGAQEVQIENNSLTWSDFVFYDNYKLRSLEDLDLYIKENKHLPEIPTEQEVRENGILVSEMNAKLLQKVEELTLYIIELKKEVEALKNK